METLSAARRRRTLAGEAGQARQGFGNAHVRRKLAQVPHSAAMASTALGIALEVTCVSRHDGCR